ncbi:MAG: hypothetical protein H0W72_09200 [Planctomycetes bacterium]|nr:hypothetical protein [Planctomycetota bacterium]
MVEVRLEERTGKASGVGRREVRATWRPRVHYTYAVGGRSYRGQDFSFAAKHAALTRDQAGRGLPTSRL